MRPPPQKASMTGLKKRGQKEQEQKETDPYAHLNLFWKPILKANLQNGDSGVHNPTKISLPKFNGETIKEFLTFFSRFERPSSNHVFEFHFIPETTIC